MTQISGFYCPCPHFLHFLHVTVPISISFSIYITLGSTFPATHRTAYRHSFGILTRKWGQSRFSGTPTERCVVSRLYLLTILSIQLSLPYGTPLFTEFLSFVTFENCQSTICTIDDVVDLICNINTSKSWH